MLFLGEQTCESARVHRTPHQPLQASPVRRRPAVRPDESRDRACYQVSSALRGTVSARRQRHSRHPSALLRESSTRQDRRAHGASTVSPSSRQTVTAESQNSDSQRSPDAPRLPFHSRGQRGADRSSIRPVATLLKLSASHGSVCGRRKGHARRHVRRREKVLEIWGG